MKEDNSSLIIKYIQNTLSEEETDAFFLWINADKKNKKLFFEVKAIYDASVSAGKSRNMEKSWQRLLEKKQKQGNNYGLWKKIASYAAVAVFAACITSIVFVTRRDKIEIASTRYIGGDGLEADMVILQDGTRVSLGSKTTFYYEPDYGQSQRNVYLAGEAYFEVKSQKDKPFIVHINGMKVEALGTAFNVMAYPGDSLFTTTLLNGSVRLTTEHPAQPVVLKSDQQLIYNRNNQTTQIQNVVAKDYIAWITGYYYFDEQSLESILHRLSYVYGITFDIRSEKLKNTEFTGTFYRGQSARDLMEIINLSVPIQYKVDDHHVTIYK
ncbi:MAG: DUF4974 domain-containing protein [Tannerella sp.]|jgi:ferric-dicitrate binding protein FerR (iron transport regulator)|nr:DUF4974 domain-containing protein [Tannerella sp.]